MADLLPALRNAKSHHEPSMTASVKEFGFLEPVIVDERTGRLLAGHGRVEFLTVAAERGDSPPEGVVVGEDGRWQWLVVRGIASRDDVHAEAMGIALNRVGELGGWEHDVLIQSLDAIQTAGLLDTVGFTADYLDDLVATLASPPDLDALADKLGEPDPADFWPVLRFKVPPDIRDTYVALVADVPGGDADQFAWLVQQASR